MVMPGDREVSPHDLVALADDVGGQRAAQDVAAFRADPQRDPILDVGLDASRQTLRCLLVFGRWQPAEAGDVICAVTVMEGHPVNDIVQEAPRRLQVASPTLLPRQLKLSTHRQPSSHVGGQQLDESRQRGSAARWTSQPSSSQ